MNGQPGTANTVAQQAGLPRGGQGLSRRQGRSGDLYGMWTGSVAKSEMLKFLATHPQPVAAVFRPAIWASASARRSSNPDRPLAVITEVTNLCSLLAYWKDKNLKAFTFVQDGGPMGYSAFVPAMHMMVGKKPKVNTIFMPLPIITNDNFSDYYESSDDGSEHLLCQWKGSAPRAGLPISTSSSRARVRCRPAHALRDQHVRVAGHLRSATRKSDRERGVLTGRRAANVPDQCRASTASKSDHAASRAALLGHAVPFALAVALFFVINLVIPGYANLNSVLSLLSAGEPARNRRGGQTLTIIIGGFDMSIPAVIGLANVLLALLYGAGYPFWAATIFILAPRHDHRSDQRLRLALSSAQSARRDARDGLDRPWRDLGGHPWRGGRPGAGLARRRRCRSSAPPAPSPSPARS